MTSPTSRKPSSGSTAFGVIDGHIHGAITLAPGEGDSPATPVRTTRDRTLLSRVADGFSSPDDGFDA